MVRAGVVVQYYTDTAVAHTDFDPVPEAPMRV